jgi:hypothetical protein
MTAEQLMESQKTRDQGEIITATQGREKVSITIAVPIALKYTKLDQW